MKKPFLLGIIGIAVAGVLVGCASGPAPDEQACSILFDPSIIADVSPEQLGAKFSDYANYAEDDQLAAALGKAADAFKTEDADSVQLYLVEAGSKCVDLGYGTAE